jgi:hypothetical protein
MAERRKYIARIAWLATGASTCRRTASQTLDHVHFANLMPT